MRTLHSSASSRAWFLQRGSIEATTQYEPGVLRLFQDLKARLKDLKIEARQHAKIPRFSFDESGELVPEDLVVTGVIAGSTLRIEIARGYARVEVRVEC